MKANKYQTTILLCGVIFILIIALLIVNSSRVKVLEKLFDAENAGYSWMTKSEELQQALDEANSNIKNAKYYAWDDYKTMGETLDNLKTVELN